MIQNAENVSSKSNESRNTWVKKHLTDALFDLLQEKTLEEISISDLCSEAQVGRASFYRNYQSKEEILKKWIEADLFQWKQQQSQHPAPADYVCALFEYINRSSERYLLLSKRNLLHILKEYLTDLLKGNKETEEHAAAAYARAYVVYVLYGWIETWLDREMKEPVEIMTLMIKNALVERKEQQ